MPVTNSVANSAHLQISQRRIESAWEKENFNPKETVDATKRIMEINNDDIASLRGWFLKVSENCRAPCERLVFTQQCPMKLPPSSSVLSMQEKRDTFKKGQTLLPVASSNRRWFTIERGEGGQAKDLLICYYKKSSAETEDRCGWLFLNDIVALSQDIPDRWITIEHPTRIMRIQSPTPAQVGHHGSKCCLLAARTRTSTPPSYIGQCEAPTLVSYLVEVLQKCAEGCKISIAFSGKLMKQLV